MQKITQSSNDHIYNYNKKRTRTWKLIQRDLDFKTVQYIEDYEIAMDTESLAKAGIQKHLETILSLSRIIRKSNSIKNKDWKKLTKRDIDMLVKAINDTYKNGRGKETWSSHDHKKILKIFFRWIKLGNRSYKKVGDPKETEGVAIGTVESEIIRERLATNDDRIKLIEGCGSNLRNVALLDCAYDAGPRAGEILNCQLKHITQDKFGFKIEVDGKMGHHPVRIILAAPSLAKWLDVHPYKTDRNAPAWPISGGCNKGKPMSAAAAAQMIASVVSRVKKKHHNFDLRVCFTLLRHREATEASNFMTSSQMESRHGWVPGSKQTRRYVHRSGINVDNALFKHHGIKIDEDDKMSLIPKICHICEMPNEYGADNCTKCGKPLSLESAIKSEEQEKDAKDKMEKKLDEVLERLRILEEQKILQDIPSWRGQF